MENNTFNISELYVGKVVSVDLNTHELEVYIPKLMPTLNYGFSDTIYSIDLQSKVLKTNTLICKPNDFKERLPDVDSLVHIRFLDNDIKKIYWLDFDPLGTNNYIEFEKTGNDKTLQDFTNMFETMPSALIPRDIGTSLGSRNKPFDQIYGNISTDYILDLDKKLNIFSESIIKNLVDNDTKYIIMAEESSEENEDVKIKLVSNNEYDVDSEVILRAGTGISLTPLNGIITIQNTEPNQSVLQNALTVDTGGLSLSSGTTYDGSTAVTISHKNTSDQTSLDTLSGSNVISKLTLDTYGHVTELSTRQLTLNDLGYSNPTITLSGDVSGSGTTSITTSIGSGKVTNDMLAGSIANNKLTNSTISGISLGSNLASLTIGSGLSGTSYNGSSAVTISHSNSITSGNFGDTGTTRTLSFGGTFTIPYVSYDSNGHITNKSNLLITMPANPDTNWYPNSFSWINGTSSGPTGSLSGVGMTAVSYPAIPSASGMNSGIITTTSQIFAGNKTFNNDVIIGGNLTVSGTNTILNTTTVSTYDDIIQLRSNATVAMTTYAGMVATKYDGTSDGALVFDNSGIAWVGDAALQPDGTIVSVSMQPIMTRDLPTNLENNDILLWDSNNYKAIGKTITELGLALDNAVVHISGTETITGLKTFSNDVRLGNGKKIYLYTDNNANYIDYYSWKMHTGNLVEINNAGPGDMKLTSGSGYIYLTNSNGNVGIGTTSPTEKLDVRGNIATNGSIIFEGSSADDFETILSVVNPTADQTYQIPNKAAGTYVLATIGDLPVVNNGTLTMSVSGIGLSGSSTFTANQSGASTFTVTSNATTAATADTLVARDSSGDIRTSTKFYYNNNAYTMYNSTDKSIDFVFTS